MTKKKRGITILLLPLLWHEWRPKEKVRKSSSVSTRW